MCSKIEPIAYVKNLIIIHKYSLLYYHFFLTKPYSQIVLSELSLFLFSRSVNAHYLSFQQAI